MNQPARKTPTPFQQKVYAACREIPAGRAVTYGQLAARIRCKSPRAVGQALRVNPFAPEVPCHRVVKADRTVGGFHGHRTGEEVGRKIRMLKAEGVRFDREDRIEREYLLGESWIP